MEIYSAGKQVRERRLLLAFSQTTLANVAGLTRVTIGDLESGKINDLGFQKLGKICETLGLTLGIFPETRDHDWLRIAAQTASTSYRETLHAAELEEILITGIVPRHFEWHMMTLIEEAPQVVVLGAVRNAARRATGDEPRMTKMIMGHIATMARAWKIRRFA